MFTPHRPCIGCLIRLDMVWTKNNDGRVFGSITEVDGIGDMKHGDASLDECFDPTGCLSYRALSELYANEVPGYNFGDPSSCVIENQRLSLGTPTGNQPVARATLPELKTVPAIIGGREADAWLDGGSVRNRGWG